MRHAVWALLALGCVDRSFSTVGWQERCPRAERLVRVAADTPIRLTWEDVQDGMTVDGVVLGRLPVGPLELQSQGCRDEPRDDYERTEVVQVELGSMALLLGPEDVGPLGTTTRVSLRSGDIVLDTLLIGPTERAEQDEVAF
jgi:hypothetical protein